MVFFSFFHQKRSRYEQCQQFCRDNRQPDSVQLQEYGQDQYNRHLEYQSPQKGNGCGYGSVSQSGEEAGAPDIKSAQKEGDRIQPESMAGHSKQFWIISNKHSGHWI